MPAPPSAAPPSFGGTLNDAWELVAPNCTGSVTGGTFSAGGFSVAVNDGEISRCANASAPAAKAQARPDDLEVRGSDVVVTAGAESYRLDLGEKGFHTTSPGAVVVRVPFDASKVPADERDGLHVFLRVHVPADHALVDVTGKIAGDAIVAELRGLPAALDVAVLYNPDMRAVSSPAPQKTKVAATKVTPLVWGAHAWCAVYSPNDPTVIAAVSQALGVAGPPSLADMDTVARTRISDGAAKAQTEYESQGFRQPDLYIATTAGEPCGGTDPRFLVHYVQRGNKFSGFDPAEVLGPDGNHFGRLYVSTGATNWTMQNDGATVLDVVAHELLHGVQAGYGIWGTSLKGYKEAASTTYGRTIAFEAREAQVRSRHPTETFLLSNFLMVSTDRDADPAYSNQDFVAYVARARNGGSPGYLTGLFQSLHDGIEGAAAGLPTPEAQDAARWQPSRAVLLGAMDSSFRSHLATDLRSEYVEFLRERAFDHGPNGYFSRAGERQNGFAAELFAQDPDPTKTSLFTNAIDPVACVVDHPVFALPGVAPLAARAVRFAPKRTTDKPVAIHIKVDGDGAGTAFGGAARLGAVTQRLENETVIDNFGRTNDPLEVAFANLDLGTRRELVVRVTCEALTDTSTPLKTSTWSLGEQGQFTVETSVTGPGLSITSDEVSASIHVAEVELASKLPAGVGLSLRVTAPPPFTGPGSHVVTHRVVGYRYTVKQPSPQEPQSTGPTMRFTLDPSTTKELGPQLFLFDVDVDVVYRTTASYEDETGQTQSSSAEHTFTALSLIAFVNVP